MDAIEKLEEQFQARIERMKFLKSLMLNKAVDTKGYINVITVPMSVEDLLTTLASLIPGREKEVHNMDILLKIIEKKMRQ